MQEKVPRQYGSALSPAEVPGERTCAEISPDFAGDSGRCSATASQDRGTDGIYDWTAREHRHAPRRPLLAHRVLLSWRAIWALQFNEETHSGGPFDCFRIDEPGVQRQGWPPSTW